MRIISVGKEEIADYELDELKKLDADAIVYEYESRPYEGSGFLVGKKGKKYFYHQMGHCSCNGPLDGIGISQNMLISMKELKEIALKSYEKYAKNVLTRVQSL